jgi:predicted Fe-Mo cluster-binding NifX family protein
METIAITDWNGIVSPMFDASCCFLVVQGDGQRFTADVREMTLFEKAEFCSSKGIKVVMCGAISNIAVTMLQDRDIRVLSWLSGPVEEIVGAFNNNQNVIELFSLPGCNRKSCANRRRFRRHGGQCGMR